MKNPSKAALPQCGEAPPPPPRFLRGQIFSLTLASVLPRLLVESQHPGQEQKECMMSSMYITSKEFIKLVH